ncbi:MAG: FixH family protein [Halioglobus sp.]
MNSANISDQTPWFKQFWPWFLITLPATVVVAAFVTLYIANKHSDDLVSKDYYKNGLAINLQLESKQLAEERNISTELEFNQLWVTATVGGDIEDEYLDLELSHPLEADRDFTVELERIEPGVYAGLLKEAIEIRWHWTLKNRGKSIWRLDGTTNREG